MNKDKKTKLVIVINNLDIGGAERLVVDQLKYFDRTRYDLTLLTLLSSGGGGNFLNLVPKDVPLYNIEFKNFVDIKSWILYIKTIYKIKPDIVISHLFFSNTVTRIGKLFLNYICITVEHNTYVYKTKAQIFLDRFLAKFTYKIVAVSKTVKDFTFEQENIPLEKFTVIHDAVDLEKINEAKSLLPSKELIRQKLELESSKVILNVARLVPQKNQELLIKAFSIFVKHHPEYKLIILGEGGSRAHLEYLIEEMNLSHNVRLPGFVDPYEYYAVSELFILTSKIEGFALVGIEAMAFGLPVISTRTAGPDEYLIEGGNGFFISESTPEGVVSALEKAINADRYNLIENALNKASEFDVRTNVKHYEDLLETALREDNI